MRNLAPTPLRWTLLSALALATISFSMACGGASKPSGPSVLSPREIMKRTKPAIVRIENQMGAQIGVGTGFLVSAEGRIATNLHVIVGGGTLRVRLADHSMHEVRRVVAIDKEHDLALIEIDTNKKLPTLSLGDSDKVEPGDSVIAIGNPMRLDYTVSDGLISSVRSLGNSVILQISAPISQGSSGGPLFNSLGEVIGVATMVSSEGQNLNFGVPINYLLPLLAHHGGETTEEFAERFRSRRSGSTKPGGIVREVPRHKTSMLDGCSSEQAIKVFTAISRAIELGAPLYNDGDHLACYNVYKQTALHYEKDAGMCKAIRDALGVGLLKAETKGDATAKAWTLRDAFDGLLAVIALRERASP